MVKKRTWHIVNMVLSLFILLSLIDIGVMAWTSNNTNILLAISFGNMLLYKIIASIVGVLGFTGLLSLIIKTFSR